MLIRNEEEMIAAGREMAKEMAIAESAILCFYGDLGAGKTTFIKGIAEGLGIQRDHVSSPTFQYLSIYSGLKQLMHFDLYRIANTLEFLEHGFDEFFTVPGIVCIEWAERIHDIVPSHAILISIEHAVQGYRNIVIKP